MSKSKGKRDTLANLLRVIQANGGLAKVVPVLEAQHRANEEMYAYLCGEPETSPSRLQRLNHAITLQAVTLARLSQMTDADVAQILGGAQ